MGDRGQEGQETSERLTGETWYSDTWASWQLTVDNYLHFMNIYEKKIFFSVSFKYFITLQKNLGRKFLRYLTCI